MTIQVAAQTARNNFADMLNTAIYGKKNVIITRFNKPSAVLMDYTVYERLMNPILRYAPKDWDEGFAVFDRIRAKTKGIPSTTIRSLVDQAVADVRRKNRDTSRR